MEFTNLLSFDPSTCISGKVMRLNRLTGNIFRKHLKPFNITDSQLSILFVLSKRGALTQKVITDILKLEKSTLNRNLHRLLEREYISRKDFPMISITQKGKLLVENIIPEWQKAMDEIKDKIEEEGIAALDFLIAKLSKH